MKNGASLVRSQKVPHLALTFSKKIFFQTDSPLIHLGGRLHPDIPIMPDLLGHPGDVCFISGISENKSVFIAVFLQPQINIPGCSVNIYRKSKLMLAVTRQGDPLLCQFCSFVLGIPFFLNSRIFSS